MFLTKKLHPLPILSNYDPIRYLHVSGFFNNAKWPTQDVIYWWSFTMYILTNIVKSYIIWLQRILFIIFRYKRTRRRKSTSRVSTQPNFPIFTTKRSTVLFLLSQLFSHFLLQITLKTNKTKPCLRGSLP